MTMTHLVPLQVRLHKLRKKMPNWLRNKEIEYYELLMLK